MKVIFLIVHIETWGSLSHVTMTGPSSELHDLSSIDRLALVIGSLAAPMVLIRPFLSETVFCSFVVEPSLLQI